MSIKQISIFVENRCGAVMDITAALNDSAINIRALSIADTAEFGIVRLIVDRTSDAVAALRGRNMVLVVSDVLAISVDDKPGGFHKALATLYGGNVSIEYSYAFVAPVGDGATVILRCDDQDKATELLKLAGIRLLSQDDVH